MRLVGVTIARRPLGPTFGLFSLALTELTDLTITPGKGRFLYIYHTSAQLGAALARIAAVGGWCQNQTELRLVRAQSIHRCVRSSRHIPDRRWRPVAPQPADESVTEVRRLARSTVAAAKCPCDDGNLASRFGSSSSWARIAIRVDLRSRH